ncbi:MAG: alpha/beta fold hydrolase [Dehalococcoidia bacterium]
MSPILSRLSFKPGIGLIVFGSLLVGFILAVMLVLVPFAGTPENVISGVVLLCFAFGWAILGILSSRLTDQPQRWTAAPAILMASAGSMLLTWPGAVLHDTFNWLWPPVVAALVAWMVVESRRSLRSRASFALLYPVFGVLLVSALGAAYETLRETLDERSNAMPGQLVSVGDHRLHIHCTGAGSPTVVLEPGLGEPSSMMAGWIAPAVATRTRVCVYDRAGRGWSEPAASPEDGVAVATSLHALLERAGEQGPYVLAGHSAGGIYVLNFAHLYPDDVAGVVLLDSMHPDQYARLPGWPLFHALFRRASALMPSLSRIGAGRVIFRTAASGLPPQARSEERAFVATPAHNRSVRDEFAQLRTALRQAGELRSLGDKPLVVLTADRGAKAGWQPLQEELARLSSNSIHRQLPDAEHASLTEDQGAAAESSQAIRDVVEAVRMLEAAQNR